MNTTIGKKAKISYKVTALLLAGLLAAALLLAHIISGRNKSPVSYEGATMVMAEDDHHDAR